MIKTLELKDEVDNNLYPITDIDHVIGLPEFIKRAFPSGG